mgnify:CR=1 FL=1
MNSMLCNQVYLDDSQFGKGVFAKRNFLKGEIIETGIMTIINNVDGNENPHLFTYPFTIIRPKKMQISKRMEISKTILW